MRCARQTGLFILNNSPSSCLEWLHLNVTVVVLMSPPFGGCGDVARSLSLVE